MPVPIRYDGNKKMRAQELRKNMTPQERRLWYDFLVRYPIQFRRQKQFGAFIADFYCSKAALIVELDGAQHYTGQGRAYDEERSWYLQSLGLFVLRFSNSEVDDHFDRVCQSIHDHVTERMSS